MGLHVITEIANATVCPKYKFISSEKYRKNEHAQDEGETIKCDVGVEMKTVAFERI